VLFVLLSQFTKEGSIRVSARLLPPQSSSGTRAGTGQHHTAGGGTAGGAGTGVTAPRRSGSPAPSVSRRLAPASTAGGNNTNTLLPGQAPTTPKQTQAMRLTSPERESKRELFPGRSVSARSRQPSSRARPMLLLEEKQPQQSQNQQQHSPPHADQPRTAAASSLKLPTSPGHAYHVTVDGGSFVTGGCSCQQPLTLELEASFPTLLLSLVVGPLPLIRTAMPISVCLEHSWLSVHIPVCAHDPSCSNLI
jgi:hypothetical protein